MSDTKVSTNMIKGTLPITNGGTNNSSLAVANGGVVYTDGSKLVNTGAGTSGQYLKSNGAGAPTWVSPGVTTLTTITAASNTKTPTASGNFSNMTNGALALTVGTWEIDGFVYFSNGGAVPPFIIMSADYFAANGADSGSSPAALSTISASLTVNSVPSAASFGRVAISSGSNVSEYNLVVPKIIVTVTSNVSIYLVPFAVMTTAANARINTYVNARRIY